MCFVCERAPAHAPQPGTSSITDHQYHHHHHPHDHRQHDGDPDFEPEEGEEAKRKACGLRRICAGCLFASSSRPPALITDRIIYYIHLKEKQAVYGWCVRVRGVSKCLPVLLTQGYRATGHDAAVVQRVPLLPLCVSRLMHGHCA